MTIDTNQFWRLLSDSQILEKDVILQLRSEFEDGPFADADVAQRLQEKGLLSRFQARILAAGQPGPFKYGPYTVIERVEQGPLEGSFEAVHRATGFPVLLHFLAGGSEQDLEQWKEIQHLTEAVQSIEHTSLAPLLETVVLPHYRFVVAARPRGTVLSEKLPRKARLPWQTACGLLAQIASALDSLHLAGVVHNALSPRTVWLGSAGTAELRLRVIPDLEFENPDPQSLKVESKFDYMAPECFRKSKPNLTRQTDLYALGCLLYRMISGRVVFPNCPPPEKSRLHREQAAPDLAKYDVPDELQQLLNRLLEKQVDQRPECAASVAEILTQLAGDRAVQPKPVVATS